MTINEQLADFTRILEDFGNKAGLNKFQNTDAVDTILESTEWVRSTWTEDELHNKSFTLFNYAAYLQKCINQNQIKLKWAQSNIRVMYGKESANYERWSYQERQDAILGNHEPTRVLHEIIMNAETRIAQLSHLSNYVSEMARSLVEMGKSKRASRYESRT